MFTSELTSGLGIATDVAALSLEAGDELLLAAGAALGSGAVLTSFREASPFAHPVAVSPATQLAPEASVNSND